MHDDTTIRGQRDSIKKYNIIVMQGIDFNLFSGHLILKEHSGGSISNNVL